MLDKKLHGVFYTPDDVAGFIVKNTLGRLISENPKFLENVRLLDPACGEGVFLLQALKYLHKINNNLNSNLVNNLFAIDIDKDAIRLCRKNLAWLSGELSGENLQLAGRFNIVSGDTLDPDDVIKKNLEIRKVIEKGGFDVIVGNPPYISYGIRGTSSIGLSLKELIKQNYPAANQYKISIYSAFIERSINLLKEGGYLGFIIPDSFLLGRFYSKLRKLILEKCSIKQILVFSKDFWKDASVGFPVILILKKEVNRDNFVKCSFVKNSEKLSTKNFKSFLLPQEDFDNNPYNRFRLFFNKKDYEFVKTLEKNSLPLGKIISISSGLIGKKGQESIVSKIKNNADYLPGLISGSEIEPFSVKYSGNFILYKKEMLKSGYRDAKYFEEKIFIRQTGDRLVSALDKSNLLCLNNLHVANLKDKTYSPEFITALLNSEIMNCYYRLITLESGRTFAQTDIETLEALPLCKIEEKRKKKQHDEITVLSKKIMELKAKKKSSCTEDLIENLKNKVNKLVAMLYT